MSFANSFSSFPPPGTAQAPRLVDTPPRPVPRAPEATVPAVPSPIGAADQLRDQQDVRDLEIVNQRLLDAIASGDKLTYSVLVDDAVTAFEPEACGHLVTGKAFHKFYFELEASGEPASASTIVEPRYRVFGDAAVVTYVRLQQRGRATTCVEIKFFRRVLLNRRAPRHRRDACSMAWRGGSLTARRSQQGRVIAEK
jgi:hypothetical protein